MIKIYADFHNTNTAGAVRLNTVGTIKDLNAQGVVLRTGLAVCLYSEDFEGPGVVEFSEDEGVWAARFNWSEIKSVTTGN